MHYINRFTRQKRLDGQFSDAHGFFVACKGNRRAANLKLPEQRWVNFGAVGRTHAAPGFGRRCRAEVLLRAGALSADCSARQISGAQR